jgi:NADH:ubiquinone reductase (H+-translocating)
MIGLTKMRSRLDPANTGAPAPGRRVLVLGGGFGGVYATLYLDQELRDEEDVEIILISDSNFLLFNPLIVEVATGGLETNHIAQPIRSLSRSRRFRFVHAKVDRIDLDSRQVVTDHGVYAYDFLVIALGSTTDYSTAPGVEAHAFALKTLRDAVVLREHVIALFERAARTPDPATRRALLTFVVAGGGPSGVEYIGELADLIRTTLRHHFLEILPEEVRLILVQSAPRLLPAIDERLAQIALCDLQRRGIEVRLNTRLTAAGPGWVQLGTEDKLSTHTLVWTTGVKANDVVASLPVEHDRVGRLIVNRTLALPGYPTVYAVGDTAHFVDARTGRAMPMLAQIAARQGTHVAANIAAQLTRHPPEPFEFHYLGSLTSLGSRSAVVDILGWRMHGQLASFVWRMVYVGKLIGFRTKVRVTTHWMINRVFGRDTSLLEPSRRPAGSAGPLGWGAAPAQPAGTARPASARLIDVSATLAHTEGGTS